jgi:RNA polymerase sigma-70 factor (ECF subfamily)
VVPKFRVTTPLSQSSRVETATSDVDVVAGLARGEEWAADMLYDRLQPVVDRTLRRLLRSRGPDYDDLVQAAFERIIRVLTERQLAEGYDLAAWSSVVTTRVALDALRRRTRENRLFSPFADDPERGGDGNLERHLEARSEIARVQHVVAKMKPKYAEAVILHDVLGRDLAEVADLTEVSVAAAQSRLVRGRKELLRRVKKELSHGA